MPDSDVKLVPGQVVAEAWDLCLDSKDRRKSSTQFRRALVHDFSDGLTVNYAGDYPGGVTIQGFVTIPDHLEVPGSTTLAGNVRLESGFEAFGDARLEGKLVVRQLLVRLTTTIIGPQRVPVPMTIEIDVGQKIAELEKRLSNIQDNWRWCHKCMGLWFAGGPDTGRCPRDGQGHSLDGSGNYHLMG
jgi:hypothetical protein